MVLFQFTELKIYKILMTMLFHSVIDGHFSIDLCTEVRVIHYI